MELVEYSLVIMLQKVKSVSGKAFGLAHVKDFEGGNPPQVYRETEVKEQPGPA